MPIFLNPLGHKTVTGELPTVVIDAAWPDEHLTARPNDDVGAAIIRYRDANEHHPLFPPSPWDDRVGDIFLPDLDGEARAATDPIPRYRLKEDAFLGPSLFTAGAEVNFPGWPVRPHTLEAVNESAERVLSYQTRYGAGRTLPGMPHQAGVLCLPNPATTFGTPLNYHVTKSIGNLHPV
jgi:hypothetical protein